jgi:hypothetical protein
MAWNVWNVTQGRWAMLKSAPSKKAAIAAIEGHLRHDTADELVPRRVLDHLEQHGTTLMQFKPEAIWRMAMDDLNRRSANTGAGSVDKMKHYHFHRDHVSKAATANDILRAAIDDLQRGRDSGKKNTRLLYADEGLLRRALQ